MTDTHNSHHITSIDSDIQRILLQREQILLRVIQSRIGPGSSMTTPISLYITNMRVIYRIPKWAGLKADIVDLNGRSIRRQQFQLKLIVAALRKDSKKIRINLRLEILSAFFPLSVRVYVIVLPLFANYS